ncbi:MAG: HAD family hydrolase [Anaerolineaceae bacterium]|nr:MAG: HAD family hydrolase [Anaerolineaceae bacterium]
MIKAVLLDLDNTLIFNDDRVATHAFLQRMDSFGKRYFQIEAFSLIYRDALRKMRAHSCGRQSNMRRLCDNIAQKTQYTIDAITAGLAIFYAEEYPQLKSLVTPRDDAAYLIESLSDAGYTLVIATNPIYPLEAVINRLEWGGLGDMMPLFHFITHADNMHYAKPDLPYYAEVIARIGVEPDEVIVIGDRIDNDISPARTIGAGAFHLAGDNTIELFIGQMSEHRFEGMLPLAAQSHMIVPQYRGNIGALFGIISEIKPRYWHQQPEPDEWSPIQIISHLLESETTVQRMRLQKILDEDNPFLAQPQPPPPPHEFDCASQKGEQLAHQWADERERTITFINTIQPEHWKRPARHSIFGPTNLLEMAQFTAQHDRLHIEQLCQTIGKCE